MLKSSLILVRHGENEIDLNKENQLLLLTDEGINQAKQVADILNGNFDIVISSTSLRAILTAILIAKNQNVIYDSAFLERGWGNEMRDGSESDLESFIRVKNAIEKYCSIYPNKKILIVFHGGLMKLAQNYIENKPFDYEREPIDNCDTIIYTKEGIKKYIKLKDNKKLL